MTEVTRILSAMTVNEPRAIERAAVEEGFSGLMKLNGMLKRVRSPNLRFGMIVVAPESDLKVTFLLTLPTEITFARDRG